MKNKQKNIYKRLFIYVVFTMKKYPIATTLFLLSCAILSGCMITWPVVDDLNHYKKWDTYESLREEKDNKEEFIEENTQETLKNGENKKAIENCINSRNNDPTLYEDESLIEFYNQFESTEDFCIEFVKTNPMFYNNAIGIDESWEPVWQDREIIEN